jgi:TolB-like protein
MLRSPCCRFVDMSADKDQEYLADGLAEEITTAGRRPRAQGHRANVFVLVQGTHAPISEIGRTLGVAHVLEGSVRKSGDRLRVTAQLIKTDDGFHLWTKTYDTKLENIFAIQDQVARDRRAGAVRQTRRGHAQPRAGRHHECRCLRPLLEMAPAVPLRRLRCRARPTAHLAGA